MKINRVAVIGATGAIGSLMSGIISAFGGCEVYMVSRTKQKAIDSIDRIVRSVKSDTIRERLLPVGFDDLSYCLSNTDWVFESVSENMDVKSEINKEISKYIRPGTIVSSGTSGLSLEKLSECLNKDQQKYYLGTHFYNPPYNMILCEIIPTSKTNDTVINEMKKYLSTVLRRKTVIMKDTPAFLGNRIGFQVLNEALKYAEEYKDEGGIDYIDAILGPYTGRMMAPLETLDFVGLDIHKAIVDNIYINTSDFAHDDFILCDTVNELIQDGKLGKKTNSGIYANDLSDNGEKRKLVYDLKSKSLRPVKTYKFSYSDKMIEYLHEGNYINALKEVISNKSKEAQICLHFMLKYIVYSVIVSNDVSIQVKDVDACMAYGYNWAPPLTLMEAFGGFESIIGIITQNRNIWPDINESILNNFRQICMDKDILSGIDYKKYFRACY